MKFLHPTCMLLAICLSAVVPNSVHAAPRALCGDGEPPSPTTTPSATPLVTMAPPTTTPEPTTLQPTTPEPTTPQPTTPEPTSAPRIPSLTLTNTKTGASQPMPNMIPRICYNVNQCSSSGYDSIAFTNFDVYGGANFLPFYEANCPRESWYGYMTIFRNLDGQADIRNADSGRTFKSFVLQNPGDIQFGPSYETKAVCQVA